MLLQAAERQKTFFSCFCALQKDKKYFFHASVHCRKTKNKFFMLLHTAERQKRVFSCFCTLQERQKKEIEEDNRGCVKTPF